MSKAPLQYFRIEARELLDALMQGALKLDQEPAGDTAAQLLRYAHTLKGAARIVRQLRISELSHAIEELLIPHREPGKPVSTETTSRVLKLVDAIATELQLLDAPKAGEPGDSAETPPGTVRDDFRTVRIEVSEIDDLLGSVADAGTQAARLRDTAKALDSEIDELEKALRHGCANGTPGAAAGRLENVRAALRVLRREWSWGADRVERELRTVQERLGELRLLPVQTIFAALQRSVRDTAEAEDKEITLDTRGGHFRLDARTLLGISEALIHLIRNAAAHGIESPDVRVAAGKSRHGRISIEVKREMEQLVFVCEDDGRGIEPARIGALAAERGLISSETAQEMSAGEAVNLILRGGLSTRENVTEQAGRGIGLETVRNIVEGLKGRLKIDIERPCGVRVEISVPASLESLEVLLLHSSDKMIALPLDAVQETRRLESGSLVRGPNGAALPVDGVLLPFVRLPALWPAAAGSETVAVILRTPAGTLALGVENLAGRARVLMQPLPGAAGRIDAVLGAFLDARGAVVPVLAPSALVTAARAHHLPAEAPKGEPRKPRVLVIDDSLTTRILEQSILESAGYEVDLAVSGEEGLEKARAGSYDVFLVDIEMHGMDGFEFIERIRDDAALRSVPAVLVSSRASPEDKLRGQRVGAQAYVVKGEFEERNFLRTISGLIGFPFH